jgi:hypothetical protein
MPQEAYAEVDIPQLIRDRFDALESSLNQFFAQTIMSD